MTFGFERPDLLWAMLLAVPLVAVALTSRRKLSPWRKYTALGLRLLLLLVATVALAGLTWHRDESALGVVFVLDRSASIDAAGQQRSEAFVREALAEQGPEDRAGVVVFGADALLEAEPRAELEVHGIESAPSPHASDLAAGLRLGSAVLPPDRARRVVLLSDGEQTRGDAAAQVMLTAGEELEVAVVPLPSASGDDVLLEDLLVPARVDEGAPWEVRVVARSDTPATGTLRLYRNEDYLGELPVELSGLRSDVFTVRQEAATPGLYRYEATLEVDDASLDTVPQNNEAVGTVQVTGRPRILYAEGKADQARHLRRALEEEGFVVDVVPPEGLPAGPSGLRPYSAIILSDVPAYVLTQRQQEAIQSYVRDLGRGLIMVGGDRSFGLGGYYRTPIEEALPVHMDIEDKTPFPKLGMVIALDKSGSMGGGAGSKLAMAKEAGIRTAELLSARDMMGVIGFDHSASWVVPFGDLSHKKQVVDTIAAIRPGGGTDIYPALEKSVATLNASDAALKHIILLSDGITSGGNFEKLIRGAHHEDVTLTSIAVGSDADRYTMESFADWGGGNYYLVTDPAAIPAIFTRETLLATQAFLVEEPFVPQKHAPSDLLKGITQEDLPTLHGYVGTEPKRRATVALTTGGEHPMPVLAHWHHGLGRSVAFTSDCKTRWSKEWLGTETYARMWTQTVRWAAGDPTAGALAVEAEIAEGELLVTVDAFTSDGSFHNFLEGEARVVAPDLTVRPVELRQVAPGRYQASLPVDQDGSWLVGVSLRQDEVVVGQSVAEAVQPYSPEYRSRGAGPALMSELGRLGGGGTVTEPGEIFTRPAQARAVPVPIWPWLLPLVALILLADVASRRLAFGRMAPSAVAESWAAVLRRPQAASRVKARPKKVLHASSESSAIPEELDLDAETGPPEPQVAPDSYAGRLLAARGRARAKLDKDEDE